MTAITSVQTGGKAEDVAISSGSNTVLAGFQRVDADNTATAGTTGDCAIPQVDAYGRTRMHDFPHAGDGVSMFTTGETAFNNTGNATLAAAATVFNVSIANTGSAAGYFKLYDKATAATSSDTPIAVYYMPATSNRDITFPKGLKLANGMSWRAVTTLAYNGTTDTNVTGVASGTYK